LPSGFVKRIFHLEDITSLKTAVQRTLLKSFRKVMPSGQKGDREKFKFCVKKGFRENNLEGGREE